MTLLEAQQLHFECLIKLGTWGLANGYKFTGDEYLRTPEQALANSQSGAGILHSLHLIRLAIDLNVFKDGVFFKTVEEYRPLGDYWKTLDPLCCWGGDFTTRPDADHFSITWQGIK